MRKNVGICRNKYEQLQESKSKLYRKKNRFNSINKNDESFETCTCPYYREQPPAPPPSRVL